MSVFKVISGAYVDFLFTIDLDGGFIYHWFLAVSLYGALVFFRQLQGVSVGVLVLHTTFLLWACIIARMFFVQLYDNFMVFLLHAP